MEQGGLSRDESLLVVRSESGGVDATDFAAMLLRMYLRWAERHGYATDLLVRTPAPEVGITSATIRIQAPNAYETLLVEQGTHRLVRVSPFDSLARRQTAFAGVVVLPVLKTPTPIPGDELRIDTGEGVRLTHLPTGIVVSGRDAAAAMLLLQSRLWDRRQLDAGAGAVLDVVCNAGFFGNQVRLYVLHPNQVVKDLRTGYEVANPQAVLDGDIDGFLEAGARWRNAPVP